MEHVHSNLREGRCDMEEYLEDKQTLQPRPRFFNTIAWGEDVDVSSESIGDFYNPGQRLRGCPKSKNHNIPIRNIIQHIFEKT